MKSHLPDEQGRWLFYDARHLSCMHESWNKSLSKDGLRSLVMLSMQMRLVGSPATICREVALVWSIQAGIHVLAAARTKVGTQSSSCWRTGSPM